jgi:hypothetical protein
MPCSPHISSERYASIVVAILDLITQAFAAADLRYKRLRLCPSTHDQFKADEGAEIRASRDSYHSREHQVPKVTSGERLSVITSAK